MDISLPLRLLAERGSLRSPLGRAPGAAPRSLPSRRARGAQTRARVWHGLAGLALDALRARRLSLRLLICATVALPLLGGGWLWLRDSQHARRARVHERTPVAVLVGPGVRTAVAGDGTVLGPALVSGSLPSIAAKAATPAPGAHVREAASLAATAVLGAAPAALLAYVTRAYEGPEGLTLQMRNGLLVYFGDAARPHAKWLSLARVLSSPNASGATYVDVRLPTRPAAGFTQPGSSSASASALTPAQVGSSDPASAQLAQRLSEEVGGASSTSSGARETETPSTGESTQSGTTESEASPPNPGG